VHYMLAMYADSAQTSAMTAEDRDVVRTVRDAAAIDALHARVWVIVRSVAAPDGEDRLARPQMQGVSARRVRQPSPGNRRAVLGRAGLALADPRR